MTQSDAQSEVVALKAEVEHLKLQYGQSEDELALRDEENAELRSDVEKLLECCGDMELKRQIKAKRGTR